MMRVFSIFGIVAAYCACLVASCNWQCRTAALRGLFKVFFPRLRGALDISLDVASYGQRDASKELHKALEPKIEQYKRDLTWYQQIRQHKKDAFRGKGRFITHDCCENYKGDACNHRNEEFLSGKKMCGSEYSVAYHLTGNMFQFFRETNMKYYKRAAWKAELMEIGSAVAGVDATVLEHNVEKALENMDAAYDNLLLQTDERWNDELREHFICVDHRHQPDPLQQGDPTLTCGKENEPKMTQPLPKLPGFVKVNTSTLAEKTPSIDMASLPLCVGVTAAVGDSFSDGTRRVSVSPYYRVSEILAVELLTSHEAKDVNATGARARVDFVDVRSQPSTRRAQVAINMLRRRRVVQCRVLSNFF